jgi:hypothetical protein
MFREKKDKTYTLANKQKQQQVTQNFDKDWNTILFMTCYKAMLIKIT